MISVLIGMRQYKDYVGTRTKYMTILRQVNALEKIPKGNERTQWHAKCDCGKEMIVDSKQIQYSPNLSCGCQRPVYSSLITRDPKQTNINYYLREYKYGATKRKLEWTITKTEFESLIFSCCYYCGAKPSNARSIFNRAHYRKVVSEPAKQRQREGSIATNGIDRVDNTKGYSIDNCVPCCQDCNYGKNIKSKEQFLEWINRVWTHQNRS